MSREEAIKIFQLMKKILSIPNSDAARTIEAIDMAIEALSAEQKEEELAKDIARRMATIIENEQDMRVILKNASAEPTDLISRADAIEAIATVTMPIHLANVLCDKLSALPSADAVQGEWHQISPARIYECSICNHNVLTDYIDTYNYCPNCGARMKGGAE